MRVTMIGAGYVGLVSGACFADFGHHVICVDKDATRVASLPVPAVLGIATSGSPALVI